MIDDPDDRWSRAACTSHTAAKTLVRKVRSSCSTLRSATDSIAIW